MKSTYRQSTESKMKSFTSLAVEIGLANIIRDEAGRSGMTLTEQIADYRNKSIALEQKVDELREQMKEMIKPDVN